MEKEEAEVGIEADPEEAVVEEEVLRMKLKTPIKEIQLHFKEKEKNCEKFL